MRLANDDSHCSGVILQRGNRHDCQRRETCLRHTESVRKQGAKGDNWITYMSAQDDCYAYIEVKHED
jgi:hypothetical protein